MSVSAIMGLRAACFDLKPDSEHADAFAAGLSLIQALSSFDEFESFIDDLQEAEALTSSAFVSPLSRRADVIQGGAAA